MPCNGRNSWYTWRIPNDAITLWLKKSSYFKGIAVTHSLTVLYRYCTADQLPTEVTVLIKMSSSSTHDFNKCDAPRLVHILFLSLMKESIPAEIPNYLSEVRIFTTKVINIDAEAVWPGRAVKRQGRDGGRKGIGGIQWVIGFGKGRPRGNTFLDHHKGSREWRRKLT